MDIFRFSRPSLPFFKVRKRVNPIFMALAHKGHKRDIVLPDNFNLEVHLAQYPPASYGFSNSQLKFQKDKIYYFLSLLSVIPARNKDLIHEEGWVPITMSYVRNNIKDLKLYKDYLINTGVIECDGIYRKGEKSSWYRWSKLYRDVNFHAHSVGCRHEEDSYFLEEKNEELENFPYLHHWYHQKKLTLIPDVNQYARSILEHKLNDRSKWDINSSTGVLKHPQTQYNSSLINFLKIQNQRYETHIDATVCRLHSVVTNLQKDYRNFLVYNGQKLVCIDIKNCQPYLACALFNPMFWSVNNQLSLSLYSLPRKVQTPITSNAITLEIESFFQRCNKEDFDAYKRMVSDGKVYENLAEICCNRLQKSIERKQAKTLMFYLFFSSNQGVSEDETINEMKRLFRDELYPKVAELFKIIKHRFADINDNKQHNRLACLLQSIESEIILHRCCKRIWEEGHNQVPVFTIHDSISTTIEHAEFVKRIMEEELCNAIGVPPTLSIEYWSLAEVEYAQFLPPQ